MAKKAELRERGTGDIMYPVTLSECILDGGVNIVVSNTNTLECAPNNYYRFDEPVNELQITLKGIEDTKHIQTLEVFLTTGDSPSIRINAEDNKDIVYSSGFSIGPNTTYEINFLFNGDKWVLAYAVIE